jgi:hypothetical protein
MPGWRGGMRTCAISFLVLRGGGTLEDEVMEMTSSGSVSQFILLCCRGNSDSEGKGRNGGVFYVRRGDGRDEDEVGREAACPPKTVLVLHTGKGFRYGTHLYTHIGVFQKQQRDQIRACPRRTRVAIWTVGQRVRAKRTMMRMRRQGEVAVW